MPKEQNDATFISSKQLYEMTYADFYNRFKTIACTLFKWENLPVGMSEIYIERVLFEEGKILFFKDKSPKMLGIMAMRCVQNGLFNYQDEPTGYNAVTRDYFQSYTIDEAVICRNTPFMIPTSNMIRLYAKRLTEVERTIETNISLQKTPWIVVCEEAQRLSMKNLMMKIEGNEPVIYGVKGGLQLDSIKSLPIETPYVADKLQEYKENLIAELHTRLGLNNANTDKRERLIVDEVNSNNEVITINYQTMLKTREEAVKLINKKFGTDIKVSLRYKIEEVEPKEGEANNGELHGNDQKLD